MKATLKTTAKPPLCQGTERSERNLKLWEQVKGMTVTIGPAEDPNSYWKCGTDEVFPIIDPAYYERMGFKPPPDGQTVYVCGMHAVKKFSKAKKRQPASA